MEVLIGIFACAFVFVCIVRQIGFFAVIGWIMLILFAVFFYQTKMNGG